MTPDTEETKGETFYPNRSGRRAMVAHARKSKRNGSNFTKPKRRKK